MLNPRTLKILLLILAAYGLFAIVAAIQPVDSESAGGVLLALPLLSVYALDSLGIPRLLAQNGWCGWRWCAPTILGWMFAAALWLGNAWLIAWGIASLTSRRTAR